MSFDRARAIANAVLLEGYVLYPYRASSRKNRFRWAFGVLAPKAWSEASACEPWWMETQCLVEPEEDLRIDLRLRFLQIQARRVEVAGPDGAFSPAESLEVDGKLRIPWEEGEVTELPFELRPSADGTWHQELAFSVPGERQEEPVADGSGAVAGRILRERLPVQGRILVEGERVDAERPLWRLRIRVENTTPWTTLDDPRDAALRGACVSSHLLLGASGGAFISVLDAPEWAAAAAKTCRSTRCFPVLAGPPGERDLVLGSPIILYDHPQVAPESPGDLCDACEIDEILTLRTLMLTDEEKRQARATDPRSAAIVDRAEALAPEHWEKLHGALRDLHRAEMVPRQVAPAGLGRGSRVRLRPGSRRTDAQDLLFAGCIATVEAIVEDVDGRTYVAVTLDDDPAADMNRWYGRYHHYELDEVEPLTEAEARTP